MLNIPESVKNLFKTDGVRKNFRVRFPDGELPDITNSSIVQESVRFTGQRNEFPGFLVEASHAGPPVKLEP